MDAGTERDVAVVLAVEDDFVGVGEHGGVVVRCGEAEQHAAARRSRAPADVGVRARRGTTVGETRR